MIVDSSFLIALYDGSELQHQRAFDFAAGRFETMFVPGPVLPETSYMLRRNLGFIKSLNFLDFFESRRVRIVPVLSEDLDRVREIALTYESARFDFVDCCIMAMSERLDITRVATFDRRDFTMFRPRHCAYLDLLP